MPRPLGGLFIESVSGRAPMAVAVMFVVGESVPVTAFIQEGPSDEVVGQVSIHGYTIDVEYVMDDFKYNEQRPTDGGGIRRRSISFSVRGYGDDSEGGPFVSKIAPTQAVNKFDWVWRRLYTGGISREEIYFEVYLIDRANQYKELQLGTTLGTYRIDFNTAWQESSELTNISLVDAMLVEDNLVGATDDIIDDRLYIFNSWFRENCIPQAYGMVPRIRTLNAFPSVDTRELSSTFNGTIRANYTDVATTILLAEDVQYGNPLLELAIISAVVRIKLGTGECVQGTLSYNSGLQQISLTSVTRNVPYATGKGYTYNVAGEIPENWGLGVAPPQSWSLRQIVIVNGRSVIQAATGWARASVNFYDVSQVPQPIQTFTKDFQLEGFGDTEDSVRHAPISHSGLSDSSISLNWNTSQSNAGDNFPYTFNTSGNLVYFLNIYKDVDLYFVDPSIGPVAGTLGDPWAVVGIEPLTVDYYTFIKDGFSKFDADHVYAEGDGTLVKIPTGKVLSIATGVSAYGSANLVRIELDGPPLEMGIGATSNVVYVDALYNTGSLENRPERILLEILNDHSLFLKDVLGDSIQSSGEYAATSWMPWIGYVARGKESLSDFIDRFCYQTAATLTWAQGLVELEQHVIPATTLFSDAGAIRTLTNVQEIRSDDMLFDESAAFSIGVLETLTQKDSDFANNIEHFEYRAMFYTLGYGAWEDPFAPADQSKANKTIPKGYRKYDYHFDLINDAASAAFAASQTLTAGHPSGFSTVPRKFKANFDLKALRLSVMDKVRWGSFPFFTVLPTPDGRPGVNGLSQWTYPIPDGGRQYVLNGFMVVDSIDLSFDVDDFTLTIEASMSQPWTEAKMSWLTSPLGVVPDAPPVPANDPNDNPGGGSGDTHTFPYLINKTWTI